MKFRPCIDLHCGKVKQIVGQTLNTPGVKLQENFVSQFDAKWYAELFKSDNLKGGHIIMLGDGNQEQALNALNAFPGGFQIGGGITPSNAMSYLSQGASHVIFSSYLFIDGKISIKRMNEIAEVLDKKQVVFDLSCVRVEDKFFVAIDKWKTITGFELSVDNIEYLKKYCSELLIHAIHCEGLKEGIDVDLVKLLADIALKTKIKITYAGGIQTLDDIKLIKKYGKGKIDFTVGSTLNIYGGELNYENMLQFVKEKKVNIIQKLTLEEIYGKSKDDFND